MRIRIMLVVTTFAVLTVLGVGYTLADVGSAGQPVIRLEAVATPEPPKEWQLTNNFAMEWSKNPAYTIEVTKPVLQTTVGKANAFNKAVEDFLAAAKGDFKNSTKDAITNAGLPGSSLQVTYDLFTGGGGILSLRFISSFYISGAAHPASYSHTLNYDLNTGVVMTLAQLFKPNARYLDVIAKYCTDDLKRRELLTFADGAAAKLENYQNWNIDRGGLLITFDDSQVGPHAQGPSEVLVPYRVFGDLAQTDTPQAWWWY
jgi:hypothetical protein